MILVDTAIWIDHLRKADPQLVELLGLDEIGCQPLIMQEIALGSLRQREAVLELIAKLYQFPAISHHEILHLANRHRLWGKGLSAIDVHLMAAVAVTPGSSLWTRDKRLISACSDLGISMFDSP
ncbi:MAG TPA: type II toxin-antitoxin system VapC family toxin [Mycobacterium sp.]|nr:type II toxin-antitoxin system VapC family toxin [Mycobacterium sp.]HQC76575.1 type II toxin-antitoxin system VapC family toxin [Mycobacterium sp.]